MRFIPLASVALGTGCLFIAGCELVDSFQDPAVQDAAVEAGKGVVRVVQEGGNPISIGVAVLAGINSIYTAITDSKRRSASKEHYKAASILESRVTKLEILHDAAQVPSNGGS